MIRRYRTITSTEHRVTGIIVMILGGAFLGFLAWMQAGDQDPPVARVAVLAAGGLAVVGLGVWIAGRRRQELVVDLASRRATCNVKGRPQWTAPIDELAPVAIVAATRYMHNAEGRGVERTEYRVVAAGRPDVPIYGDWSYPPARRVAERAARDWRVGLCGLDGRIRAADRLDAPLWAIGGPAAPAAFTGAPPQNPLPADAGVSIEQRDGSTLFTSSVLPRGPELPNWMYLAAAGGLGLAMMDRHADLVLIDPTSNPLDTAIVAALGLAFVGALSLFGAQLVRFLQPPIVSIDRTAVRYRGRTLAAADVREVVDAGGIEILTSRRHITLPPGFCDPAATDALVRELRRAIVDHGAGQRA